MSNSNNPRWTVLTIPCIAFSFAMLAAIADVSAADHRVEALASKAPEGLAAPIAAQLAETGFKVIRGSTREICHIWLCKQWSLKSLEAKGDVNYPFVQGQLMGAIYYPRKGSDFRDQDIDSGLYTLRYAQQPVDGAHVGTSPTRDFLLLVRAEADKSADVLNYATLSKASIEAAQTSHPALLSLQKPKGDGKSPSIQHNEDKDWWIVRLQGQGKAEGKTADLPIDLVVAGQASE